MTCVSHIFVEEEKGESSSEGDLWSEGKPEGGFKKRGGEVGIEAL